MQSSQLLKKVRQIEISAGRLVSETFAGKYHSVFKGQGMEFAEARHYVPGDDVRRIDWNISARLGEIFIKEYREERQLTLMLVCDVSASKYFGSTTKFKQEIMAELSALFAFSALKNYDKVGLILFSDKLEKYIPAKKGQTHILRIIRELLAFKPTSKGTNLTSCLETVNKIVKRHSIVLLLSDFLDKGFEKPFRFASKKHELIPVIIEDKLEINMPKTSGYLDIENPETGEKFMYDLTSKNLNQNFINSKQKHDNNLDKLFASLSLEHMHLSDSENMLDEVVKFFRQRAKRLKKG
ncbi:MAG: DUF58 domain-containing protein [Elusimicrobiaceae bacterium]|jgi:uncharacterized protein (DUF58 family)|nr:DUF58 domain-containing protein [Elusimicrobiaceae bacterium]MBT3954721.1 DUF58 domain-containing protein [Elusimicrobiaceae bacterium]MBT4008629.1 DUF58 domain-containing protein [Elusimicrobiaceae bacterium]MBT4402461.1 DUF58 domain-containing protein [Elusimicrobiaceae bacterium]MBT4439393.1 DUF58 domain-containing protein [Elusimicrobiaceae bacterium]